MGSDIYEALVKEYAEKQRGRKCRDLPAFIIKRLPVCFAFDNNYFDDAYQCVPKGGYNRLVDALLEGADVRVNCDFLEHRQELQPLAARLVFTGRIDEYFGFCFCPLAYRALRFEEEVIPVQNWQGNAVVNYTGADVPYTRIIEHKHFERESTAWERPVTVISREYTAECAGDMEGFYPVNDAENSCLYQKYKALADKESAVLFGGRLAEYKYYDMDDVIAKAMQDFSLANSQQLTAYRAKQAEFARADDLFLSCPSDVRCELPTGSLQAELLDLKREICDILSTHKEETMRVKLDGSSLKILVCCSKPCSLPDNPDGIFLPVFAGAALSDSAAIEEQLEKWMGGAG